MQHKHASRGALMSLGCGHHVMLVRSHITSHSLIVRGETDRRARAVEGGEAQPVVHRTREQASSTAHRPDKHLLARHPASWLLRRRCDRI
eukprot:4155631-Prymnesium_polylepis.1